MINHFPYVSRNSVGIGPKGRKSLFSDDSLDYFSRSEVIDADAFDQTSIDTTQTTPVNKRQINEVVKGLKANGLWGDLVEAWWFRDTSFAACPAKLKHSAAFPELINERMYFDGVDDYVVANTYSFLDEASGKFSFKFVSTDENSVILADSDNDVAHRFQGAVLSSGKIGFEVRETFSTQNLVLTTNTFNDGELHEVEIASDGASYTITVDGVEEVLTGDNNGKWFNTISRSIMDAFVVGGRISDSGFVNGFTGVISDLNFDDQASYQGYGNTNADWEDQIGSNDGTVNGSPALYTGQGGNSAIVTLNNYVSGDYLSEGTDPGLLGNDSTKTETTTYTATVTGSVAVFTANGSFYGECEIPASYTSSEYNLGRKECLFIFNRALTAGERTSLETIMVNQGARPFGLKAGVTSLSSSFRKWSILTSFDDSWDTGAVTDFFVAWFNNSLTSFPLLDTSSGTRFYAAWANNSLTSFPLINTSSGTNFRSAWRGNSLLTDFPAGFFDAWNPASIVSAVFNDTWDGCTSLTSTSVENILVSLDTSGKYGTSDGLSNGTVLADNTIDIDYDGSGLTAATNTAITNLKAKDWQVEINGVLQ